MTRHYPNLGNASDWSCRVGNLIQPNRSTTQIWVVTRHQYGISALVSQTSFGGETSVSVAKCRLFSHVRKAILFAFRIEFLIALKIIQLENKNKQGIFGFRPETLPGLSRNGPEVPAVQNQHLSKGIQNFIM